MTLDPHSPSRRIALLALSSLAVGALVPGAAAAGEAKPAEPPATGLAVPPGKPGEFDFLAGNWTIQHRRLKTPTDSKWDEFAGEATCWTILGGVGSVEELRIPARDFSGMGLRLLDVEKKIWSDFWVNAKSGALFTPGTTGGFERGAGTFISEEVVDGRRMLYRGVWDRITPRSCRWHQASSKDEGRTWDANWFMDWTRV